MTTDTLVHDTSIPASSIPLKPIKSEGRWQRCLREMDWLDTDALPIDLNGHTVDSVRRCLQSAIRSAGRSDELYVVTDRAWLETRSPATEVVLMRR